MSVLRLLALLFCLFLWATTSVAQGPDTLSSPISEDLDPNIEDLIIGTQSESQVDFTFLTDQLQQWRDEPLDLNTAAKEDLLLLPGMTELLYQGLIQHISTFGPLTSLYELQAVRGFDLATIREIQPFITVKDIGATDISPGVKHPAGPEWGDIWEGMEYEFIQRAFTVLETQRDTPLQTLLSAPYSTKRATKWGRTLR